MCVKGRNCDTASVELDFGTAFGRCLKQSRCRQPKLLRDTLNYVETDTVLSPLPVTHITSADPCPQCKPLRRQVAMGSPVTDIAGEYLTKRHGPEATALSDLPTPGIGDSRATLTHFTG
jgi:hypothetical protein